MRVLHAIHDFLPRHRAGSEIYACDLARTQSSRHAVQVLAAEYDPSVPHGTIRWRQHETLTVVELVNNWEFRRFEESYSSARLNAQLSHVLDATAPDVLHVHNLLNLSMDLPRIARERGIAVVATLHDYTLVCASGGQRVHVADAHVCGTIDPERCARCFPESAHGRQMAAGFVTASPGGRLAARVARLLRHVAPEGMSRATAHLPSPPVDAGDISRRLAYARHVLGTIDLLVAPSGALAREFESLGADPRRVEISDYGFAPVAGPPVRRVRPRGAPLEVGFVGTLVWHKGAHVLLEAAHGLTGAMRLHLHGDTSVFPDYVARLRAAAGGMNVLFHGGFGLAERTHVYEGLDVLVVPSLWPENSPLVIHEGFMHGLPIVAARTGGIPGLVQHDVNGLLYEPFSSAALRSALQQLIDSPDLVLRLGSTTSPVKSIEQDAREWDARYERVIHNGRGRSGNGRRSV